MSKDNEYHMYVDGCSMIGSNKHGIGWVQLSGDGKYLRSHAERLPIQGATSTIAEIYAAQNALTHIKDGSKVTIYSDNAAVCEAIATKSFYEDGKHRKSKLSEAWSDLAKAAAHEEVSVIFTRESDQYYMHRAHLNAQTGAMKPLKSAEERELHKIKKHSKNSIYAEIYSDTPPENENTDDTPELV